MARIVMEFDDEGKVVGVAGRTCARSLRKQIQAVAKILKRENQDARPPPGR